MLCVFIVYVIICSYSFQPTKKGPSSRKSYTDHRTQNVLKIVGGVIGGVVCVIFVVATGHYLKKKYGGIFLNTSKFSRKSPTEQLGNGNVKYRVNGEDFALYDSSISGSSSHTAKSYRTIPQKV